MQKRFAGQVVGLGLCALQAGGLAGCGKVVTVQSGARAARLNPAQITPLPQERILSILATNDIHGGIEAGPGRDGVTVGGMDFWSGVVNSIRAGMQAQFGAAQAGVLIVDAGDQFQGTLISNYNEGQLMFAAMNEVGYDAAITGNHDYDFGPIGWLDDQVTSTTKDQNPRGALLRAIGTAQFPIISANTYLRASIMDAKGNQIAVSDQFCKPRGAKAPAIDWSSAAQPSFLKPYVIKQVAGVKVALIGLDNPETPIVTTEANVTDLCFDDEVGSYLRIRQELQGQADVFVVVMHDGNTDTSFEVSDFVKKLPAGSVDAVISGHTHYVTNTKVNGIAIIQSGSGGEKFGRIDLVYDTAAHAVVPAKTRSYGGVDLFHDRCAPSAKDFCTVSATGQVSFEGVPVVVNARITALVADARAKIASMAGQHLGTATSLIKIDRTRESPLANAMTDALQGLAKSDIAFMNTGGLRAPVPAGDFTYEVLFKVLPFNNHGLLIGPMGADKVIALLQRSITTCGSFGALMQSGLRVTFERDCTHPTNQLDPQARLLTVATVAGEVIYDASRGGMVAPAGRTFTVATLDFLAAGGSGFDGFKGTPVLSDIGVVREAMAAYYASNPATLTSAVDGRWAEKLPDANAGTAPVSR